MVFELIFFLAKFTILHNSNAWNYGVADECVKGLFLTLKKCQKKFPHCKPFLKPAQGKYSTHGFVTNERASNVRST